MQIYYKILSVSENNFLEVEEVKNYLRISHDYDDKLISEMIKSAVEYAENYLGINIVKREVQATINDAQKFIFLKYPKIRNINNVIIIKNSGNEDITKDFGTLIELVNQIELNHEYVGSNIEVNYDSGYVNDTPYVIKQGVLTHISNMYEYTDSNEQLMYKVRSVYDSYRKLKI